MEQILSQPPESSFTGAMVGVEKEGLRVCSDGPLSQSPHPRFFGTALTHPCITTDFSEAPLEPVTLPCSSRNALGFLTDTETFVRQQLINETIRPASMPCFLSGEAEIPISRFGSSDPGRMKTTCRRGHAHRYGKIMQVIAEKLDNANDSVRYAQALAKQRQKLIDPELTPSAPIISVMRQNKESCTAFAIRKTTEHHDYYQSSTLADGRYKYYEYVSLISHGLEKKMETSDSSRDYIDRLILNGVTAC